MIPYIEHPSINVLGYTIYAFGVMLMLAVVVGLTLVSRQAPRYGMNPNEVSRLTFWTLLCSIVGSHWFAALTDHPERVADNPLELLNFSGSMSSIGGLIGGLLGAIVILRRNKWSGRDTLRFMDMVVWAFPFAWLFARFGCTLAHDHIGIESDLWIAVDFPHGPRLDLGLMEWVMTIPIAISFYLLRRSPRPPGFYVALFCVLYGPLRICLDSLRVDDVRYWSATPSQYVAIAATLAGSYWLYRLRLHRKASVAESDAQCLQPDFQTRISRRSIGSRRH